MSFMDHGKKRHERRKADEARIDAMSLWFCVVLSVALFVVTRCVEAP